MINVYLLLDYRVHGFYVFSMGFFISYLRHVLFGDKVQLKLI